MRSYGTGSFSKTRYKRKDGTLVTRTTGYLLASDRKKIWGSGKTQPAAEKKARANLAAYELSLQSAPTGDTFEEATIAGFAQQLLSSKKRIAEKSVAKYAAYIGYLMSPEFAILTKSGQKVSIGTFPIKSVGTYELELFMENLSGRYAPKTVREFRTWLITQFRKAVNYGIRPGNPARELDPVDVPEPPPIEIEPRVLNALIEAAECSRMKAALVLMMHGLRFGEVFGLTWEDFEGNVATIRRQLQPKRIECGHRRELTLVRRKKGGAAYQARFDDEDMKILVDSVELARPLEIWAECQGGSQWILEKLTGVRMIVPDSNGKPWPETSFRRDLKKLLDQVPEAKGLTPHSFRAWMATTLLDIGTPLKHVQKSLGHSRSETTLHYQRSPDELSRLAHDAITAVRKGKR